MPVSLEEIRDQSLYSANTVRSHSEITADYFGAVRRYLPTWTPSAVDDALYKVIQAMSYVTYVYELKYARAVDSTTLRGANLDDLKVQALNRGVEVYEGDTADQVRFRLANQPLSYATGSIATIEAQAREISGVLDALAIRRTPLTAIDVYVLSGDAIASPTLRLQVDLHLNQHDRQLAGLQFVVHPADVVDVSVSVEIVYYPDRIDEPLAISEAASAINAMLAAKRQRFVESDISDSDIIAAGKVEGVFDVNVLLPSENLIAPTPQTIFNATLTGITARPVRIT